MKGLGAMKKILVVDDEPNMLRLLQTILTGKTGYEVVTTNNPLEVGKLLQEEAFDLADRIGVMSYGRLIEVGTPRDLYMHPQTEFVASFLGTANILLGKTEKERIRLGHVLG
jgi:ABC-type methionine transport system ATPase subunit